MTPIAWLRGRIPTPDPTLTVDSREEIVARLDQPTSESTVDRSEPTCPEQLDNPQEPAPAHRPGSDFGMCRFPGLRPYSEADDEIGGSKRYDDGLGD